MRRSLLMLACLAGTLAVAGCARDTNLARDGFAAFGVAAKVPPAPDFVVSSRTTGQEEYIPVGVQAPPRKLTAKTPAQIKEVEGQLDAVREKTEAKGAAAAREGTNP